MRVTICELNDEPSKFTHDWELLVKHARKESSDLVVLSRDALLTLVPRLPEI